MATNPLTSNLSAPLSSSLTPASRTAAAADQRGVYLPSDDARSQLPRGVADQRGMYLPSDDARSQLPRGAAAAADPRGMYLPSDDRRSMVAPPRGTERVGKLPLPYDGGSRLPLTAYDQGGRLPLSSTGTDLGRALLPTDNLGRPLLSRGTEHGMRYPSDHHEPWGVLPKDSERGGIFLTSDEHALTRQVEQLHIPDARYIDVKPLLRLVEDIIERSTQAVEGGSLQGTISKREASLEPKYTLNAMHDVPELPLIVERVSCEMTCKVLSGVDAHSTTLGVLNMLQHFSWEAKVVLTLAAFALTYGDFWLLVQIYSTNALGKAMALIKRLPMVVEGGGAFKHQFDATNKLIKAMLETTSCIVEFVDLPGEYISPEDPEVKAAFRHFPIAVYWIVRSAVAAATHITTLSSKGLEYNAATPESWELSNWAHKLKTISDHLRETLSKLNQYIREKRDIDAYNMIRKIIYETIHIDNMKVLNVLIYAENAVPPLHDGPNKTKVHLEVLRKRNVLLLISGLDISTEELSMLEQCYTESKVHSYDIVWIPVVEHHQNLWTNEKHTKFEELKASMPWYSVDHPRMIENAVIKFIKEDWHFRGRTILVVLDPNGKVVSPNAIHMMWIWHNKAFPFTSVREESLWAQETWNLELLVNSIDVKISEWIAEGKYIFMYGGDDIEWIRKFTKEAHAVARSLGVSVEMVYVGKSHNKDLVRRVTDHIMTEQLSHFLQDPTFVWYFWTRIESMIYSKIQLDRVHDHGDEILQELQRLHSHDKSHGGWAILAEGSKIVVHGYDKLTLETLQALEHWKNHALENGFGPGYRSHYHELYRKNNPCHTIPFPSNVKPPKSMLCPDCRRHMQRFHSFICCHEDPGMFAFEDLALAPTPAYVPGMN